VLFFKLYLVKPFISSPSSFSLLYYFSDYATLSSFERGCTSDESAVGYDHEESTVCVANLVYNIDSNTNASWLPDTDNYYCSYMAVNTKPTSAYNEFDGKIESCVFDVCN
jgi:hypothetical protein